MKKMVVIISIVIILSVSAMVMIKAEAITIPEDIKQPFLVAVWDALGDLQYQIDSFFDVFVEIDDTDNWDKDVNDDITECLCPITQQQYDDVIARLDALEGGGGGCTINSDCLSNEYCAKATGACDDVGECQPKPTWCPDIYNPICGCDAQTYDNVCLSASTGMNIDYLGECTGTPCDDGNPCTYNDMYIGSVCEGISYNCDAHLECNSHECDGLGGCFFEPTSGTPCDDGDMCTIEDVCMSGICQSGALLNCDDGNICTSDSCNFLGGCTNVPDNSMTCSDGFFCNGNETCSDGSCISSVDPCPGPDLDGDCSESCDESSNDCTANDPDGSPCFLSGTSGTCSDANCTQ